MADGDDIFEHLFGDPAVAECLSDRARLQGMLDVESALSDALAALNIIPAATAARVREAADADLYDLPRIASEAASAGNLAIPLVKQLTERVASVDAESARYVHWGATSQDVIDTGAVLQLRAAVTLVHAHVVSAAGHAAALASRHANDPMPGRTWLQHGPPTTFGLKAAGWVDALSRGAGDLSRALAEASVLQFGGAAGTLAALGARGMDVTRELGRRLDLVVPDTPWHAHRDRFVRLGCALGVIAGTAGKIARDVSLLAQTEVREAYEGAEEGRGGSSTMPHKQNPVRASVALAAAARTPGLVATLLGAMPQEHERGLGGWQAEWETLPELVRLTAGAARAIADLLQRLTVDTARMRENVAILLGVGSSEAIAMKLAERIGKADAHRTLGAASRRALAEHRPLADILAEDPEVTRAMSRDEVARLLSADGYLGSASVYVDLTLARYRETLGKNDRK